MTLNFVATEGRTAGAASCTFVNENGEYQHKDFAVGSLVPMSDDEVKAYYDDLKNQKSAAIGVTPLDKMVKIATILSPIALVAFTVVNGCNQKQLNQLTDELNSLKKSITETSKINPKPH